MSEQIDQNYERLKEFRQSVRALFEKAAWPTSREEEWRRTDIEVFNFDALGMPDKELLENSRAERKSKHFIALNDQSLPPEEGGLTKALFDRAIAHLEQLRDNPGNRLILWNLLHAEDIFLLHIPAESEDAQAHELCWHSLGEDLSRHLTLIVLADDLSRARVLLRFKGMEGHVQNFAAVYALGDGARLNVSVLQESSDEVLAFYQAASTLGRDASFTHFEVLLGGGFVKNSVDVELRGSGSNLNLNGMYFADSEQHIDMRTVQHHIADHADSRTFYKGVIKDEAETIFQGLIEVNHEARGTDAYLTNNNLLLNEGAKADSIPSLNIKTDDVKCSHGSTTGKLNEEHIYYFQSRGFSRKEAEEFLILGYFEELITAYHKWRRMRPAARYSDAFRTGARRIMGLLSKKGGWHEAVAVDSFQVSCEVIIGYHRYTLFKLEDGIHCTQGSCSHEHSPLCQGIVMDGKVFCEKHGSRFDIRTGKVIDLPATENLKTYEVKVEEGMIFIKT